MTDKQRIKELKEWVEMRKKHLTRRMHDAEFIVTTRLDELAGIEDILNKE